MSENTVSAVPFEPKKKPNKKKEAVYKTLYMPAKLAEQVEILAKNNGTSFNHMIISMIEYCLEEDK